MPVAEEWVKRRLFYSRSLITAFHVNISTLLGLLDLVFESLDLGETFFAGIHSYVVYRFINVHGLYTWSNRSADLGTFKAYLCMSAYDRRIKMAPSIWPCISIKFFVYLAQQGHLQRFVRSSALDIHHYEGMIGMEQVLLTKLDSSKIDISLTCSISY